MNDELREALSRDARRIVVTRDGPVFEFHDTGDAVMVFEINREGPVSGSVWTVKPVDGVVTRKTWAAVGSSGEAQDYRFETKSDMFGAFRDLVHEAIRSVKG